ncbi:MAG: DUF6465 family protein [Eubacteriales bacterium]|nr:DUF6465 family protein [Eubacteriales bacterium]
MVTKRAAKKTEAAAKAVKSASVKAAETVEAVKAEPVKETTKKPAVRRTTKKAAEKTVNTEVFVQFNGKEVYAKDVVETVKKLWTEEMGKKAEELNDLKVYIKPEENRAYYVINGDVTGCIEL